MVKKQYRVRVAESVLGMATTCTIVTSGTTTDSTNIRGISSYGTQMDLLQFFMKLQLPDQLPDSIISKLLVEFLYEILISSPYFFFVEDNLELKYKTKRCTSKEMIYILIQISKLISRMQTNCYPN